jgi:hypothetical protein
MTAPLIALVAVTALVIVALWLLWPQRVAPQAPIPLVEDDTRAPVEGVALFAADGTCVSQRTLKAVRTITRTHGRQPSTFYDRTAEMTADGRRIYKER